MADVERGDVFAFPRPPRGAAATQQVTTAATGGGRYIAPDGDFVGPRRFCHAPAGLLGIAFVWINRYKERNVTPARPLAWYPDLKSLADVAGEK